MSLRFFVIVHFNNSYSANHNLTARNLLEPKLEEVKLSNTLQVAPSEDCIIVPTFGVASSLKFGHQAEFEKYATIQYFVFALNSFSLNQNLLHMNNLRHMQYYFHRT